MITADDLEAAFPLARGIQTQVEVFAALSRGEATMGARGVLPNGADAQFAYLARASMHGPTIVKFGSVTPGNADRNIPVVQSYVGVLNQTTGALEEIFDGEMTTKIRTTAASMMAAQTLANPVKNIAIIGAGHTAQAHAAAALELFNPEKIIVVARKPDSDFKTLFPSEPRIIVSLNLQESIEECDLIFVCTNSVSPVVVDGIGPGKTLISIGSFAPNREEVSGKSVLQASRVFVDDAATARIQNGSIVSALEIDPALHVISIGDVINQKAAGRTNSLESIMYFSVGLGIQDAAIVEAFRDSSAQPISDTSSS